MFRVGSPYTRAEVLRALGIEDTGGGVWYTGLAANGDDHYIFCGVGTPGRTGHDYGNHFDGPDLVWRGRTGSQREHPSIQALIGGRGKVHMFFRDDNRQPFTYAGTARAVAVNDAIPVEIRWSFGDDPGPHARVTAGGGKRRRRAADNGRRKGSDRRKPLRT